MAEAALAHLLSLRPDVAVHTDRAGLWLTHRWGTHPVPGASPALRAALRHMAGEPSTVQRLDEILAGGTDLADLTRLREILDAVRCAVVRTLDLGGTRLLSVEPTAPGAGFAAHRPRGVDVLRLSRFAVLARHGDTLGVETPLRPYRVRLLDPRACQLVAALAGAATPGQLARQVTGCPPRAVDEMVGYLTGAGVVAVAGAPRGPALPRFPEDDEEPLRLWETHDLVFHARSRLGRHDGDVGAGHAFLGRVEPEPPVRPARPGPVVPLPRPDLAEVAARDPALVTVMESRRSLRRHGGRPVSVRELGELLYRAARVRAIVGPLESGVSPAGGSDRPYPSDVHALELYLTVHRAAGLDRAAYHYDPVGHRLVRLGTGEADIDALLGAACAVTGEPAFPDVLLTVTARFARATWSHSGMAYAGVLKDVGVLYQTLYLVATAMGLAPCALRAGDADLSARAFGLDWARESSVGEFTLGRPAEGPV